MLKIVKVLRKDKLDMRFLVISQSWDGWIKKQISYIPAERVFYVERNEY